MDEITWVRQHRMKKMARFALAGVLGLLLALLVARPFHSAAQTPPPPPKHGPRHGPHGPEDGPERGPHRPKMALSAEQVAASVATATAAQPGLVTKTDGERDEAGGTVCVVDVQGTDGGHYHVAVDVAANSVLQVEAH